MISQCKRLLVGIADKFQRSFFHRLYDDMDGVYEVSAESQVLFRNVPKTFGMNLRHALPFLLYLLFFVQLLYQLALSDFNLDLIPGDNTFGRKVLPSSIGKQADIFWIDIGVMVVALAGQWLFHNLEPFERQFRMVAVVMKDGTLKGMLQNGQVMNRLEAEAIYRLSQKAKVVIEVLTVIIDLEGQSFYLFNVWAHWKETATDYLTALWMIFYLPPAIMHIYAAIYAFILNGRYLRVKQRLQMDKLQSIAVRMSCITRKSKVSVGHRLEVLRLLERFFTINRRLDALHREILGYNGFWSRYLSAYFSCLTFLVTYFAYLFNKPANRESLLTFLFLSVFGTLLFGMLLGITRECSVIVLNNKETLKLQRKIAFEAKKTGAMRFNVLEKFDKIEADSRSLEKIGFKIFSSVKINSQMFELLLFYISSLFMKIVQNEL